MRGPAEHQLGEGVWVGVDPAVPGSDYTSYLIEPMGDLLWIEALTIEGEAPLIEIPEKYRPKSAIGRVIRPSQEMAERWPVDTQIVFDPRSYMEAFVDQRQILLIPAGEILARVEA